MIIRTLIEAAVLLVVLYGIWHVDKLKPIVEWENRIIEKIFEKDETT